MAEVKIDVNGEINTSAARIRIGSSWDDGTVIFDRGSNPGGEIVVEVSDGSASVVALLTQSETIQVHDWLSDKVALWESPTYEIETSIGTVVTLPRSKGPRCIEVGFRWRDGCVGLGVNRDGSVSVATALFGDGSGCRLSIIEAKTSKNQARALEAWLSILVKDWGV